MHKDDNARPSVQLTVMRPKNATKIHESIALIISHLFILNLEKYEQTIMRDIYVHYRFMGGSIDKIV